MPRFFEKNLIILCLAVPLEETAAIHSIQNRGGTERIWNHRESMTAAV